MGGAELKAGGWGLGGWALGCPKLVSLKILISTIYYIYIYIIYIPYQSVVRRNNNYKSLHWKLQLCFLKLQPQDMYSMSIMFGSVN